MKSKVLLVIGLCMGMTVSGCGSDTDTAVEAIETQETETETVTKMEQTEAEEEPEERKPEYLFCELPFDGEDCIVADTTIPVLILTSQADEIVPMEQSQRLYDAIRSSHKKIVISKISAHVSMKSTEHELYEKEVRNFLGL